MNQLKFFKHTLIEELSISDLQVKFADHHRLGVFARKGCVCVTCGKVGTRLLKSVDRGGAVHIDPYTDDLVPITIDHILPKSRGGENHIDNYQPMCFPCNNKKGNGMRNHNPSKVRKVDMNAFTKASEVDSNLLVGMRVYRITKYAHVHKSVGVVDSVGKNPHSGQPAAIVLKNSKVSYYDLSKSLYVENTQLVTSN
jgi:hypothetical protein